MHGQNGFEKAVVVSKQDLPVRMAEEGVLPPKSAVQASCVGGEKQPHDFGNRHFRNLQNQEKLTREPTVAENLCGTLLNDLGRTAAQEDPVVVVHEQFPVPCGDCRDQIGSTGDMYMSGVSHPCSPNTAPQPELPNRGKAAACARYAAPQPFRPERCSTIQWSQLQFASPPFLHLHPSSPGRSTRAAFDSCVMIWTCTNRVIAGARMTVLMIGSKKSLSRGGRGERK